MVYKVTEDDLARVEGLSSREAAKVLGVGKTAVNEARNRVTTLSDVPTVPGSVTVSESRSEAPWTLEEARQVLTTRVGSLDAYNVTYGFSERELASGVVSHTFTSKLTPKPASQTTKLDADELVKAIADFQFVPSKKASNPATFVITPSDLQIGKTSFNGGTEETIQGVMESYGRAVEFVKEFRPAEILFAELGDPLENFYSTSSQRETNDLDLTGQIRVARRLLLAGVKELAPYTDKFTYATVPSNHGSVRVAPKSPAGDNHNDWGLSIADAIEDAVRENSALGHVSFVRPEKLYESVTVTASGTRVGLVHGHQAGKAEGLSNWWKKQDHGRQPTANADILLAGHFHSFRVVQSGSARWIFVSPSSDPGSDWFTNITGEYSVKGMLSFTTSDGAWDNLRIL